MNIEITLDAEAENALKLEAESRSTEAVKMTPEKLLQEVCENQIEAYKRNAYANSVAKFGEAITLLTDTAESGFRAVASRLVQTARFRPRVGCD